MKRRKWTGKEKGTGVAILLIVLAGALAYSNSLGAAFVLDDMFSIVGNPTICQIWPIWKAFAPSSTSFLGGRPVLHFTFAVNYALGGLSPWGYHLINGGIHLLAGLTLFGLVRRTLQRQELSGRFGSVATELALAVALLWTVHPLQTGAVTYVSQRCESLMGLFYLLTLYSFLRGVESRHCGWWFAAAMAVCGLGMACKEVMVTAPVMVFLFDRTFVAGSVREAWQKRKWLYVGLGASWLVLAGSLTGLHHRSVGYGLGVSPWEYALKECRAIVQYLRLAFWPHPLVFDYGDSDILAQQVAAVIPQLLFVLSLVIMTLVALKVWPKIGFLGFWFLAILSPTSSLIPVAGSPMAEHRMYLPLVAVVTLLVIGGFEAGRCWLSSRMVSWKVLVASVAGLVVLALTILTIRRNDDYTSAVALWQDTVAKCPNNSRAHNNLAKSLLEVGRTAEAIAHSQEAIRLKPRDAHAHYNLSQGFLRQGNLSDAVAQLREALRWDPVSPEIRIELGNALTQQGNFAEAIAQFEMTRRSPEKLDAETHYNWGVSLLNLDRPADASVHFRKAIDRYPDYAEAHNNLGAVLLMRGDSEEAERQFREALRLNPDFADAKLNLSKTLATAHQWNGQSESNLPSWKLEEQVNPRGKSHR